jgi:DNA-directed RNA polymerase specialized sigma24 family protein
MMSVSSNGGRFGPLTDAGYELPEPSDLFAALAQLSDRQRAAVVLHHLAGYPLKEIATVRSVAVVMDAAMAS